MKIEKFNSSTHRSSVETWGEKHGFPFPPTEFLPDLGWIVGDAAVGFLYTTNSKLGWVEWVFSNPAKTADQRREAIDLLMGQIQAEAFIKGVTALFSSSGSDAYLEILKRHDFIPTDKNVIQHIKRIGAISTCQH